MLGSCQSMVLQPTRESFSTYIERLHKCDGTRKTPHPQGLDAGPRGIKFPIMELRADRISGGLAHILHDFSLREAAGCGNSDALR